MKKIKCKSCDTQISANLEFCPKCGCFNEFSDHTHQQDEYNKPPQTTNDLIIGIAKDLSTIKKIMVFFTWLWAIGVALGIIILIANL